MRSNNELFNESLRYMPGGVNSPVRAFKAVEGTPRFISRAKGSRIFDEEGNEFIDYCGSWGPMILGHAQEDITKAVCDAASKGTSFGAPTARELDMARLICESVPSVDMVRMVNSGTEAVMSAARLARAYTKRDAIVKFNGCYHGHWDSFLVAGGSGMATLGQPSSPGVPKDTVKDTIQCEFNDKRAIEEIFKKRGKEIAAVILEPVTGNMGVILPEKGFLEKLRELTSANGTLLIFDEVMTGFRIGRGGVQERYGVMPDLTTLGKIIGGGLPVGAYGGKREIMSMMSPQGPVYQAGTLSGNPIAMSAGYAMLKQLVESDPYPKLERTTKELVSGFENIISSKGYPLSVSQIGSMFCVFFRKETPHSWHEVSECDTKAFAKYFTAMLDKGVYVPPSQFEACFVSTAHSKEDVQETINAFELSLREIFA